MSTEADIAVLETKVEHLTNLLQNYISSQEKKNERYETILERLNDMASRGGGAMWMIIGLGGIVTTILSNLPVIKKLFS